MSPTDVIVAPANQRSSASNSKKCNPTREEIEARAYEIFLLRGATPGSDVEDWLQAERELRVGN